MRTSLRWLNGAVGAIVFVIAPVAPAGAHSVYDRSDPADGATLHAPVDELWIDFTSVIDPRASQSYIVLTDPCDTESNGSNYRYLGKRMTVGIEMGSPGAYEVFWRVLDPQDGHVTYGTFGFTLTGDPTCATATATPTAPPSPTPSTTPSGRPTRPAIVATPRITGSGSADTAGSGPTITTPGTGPAPAVTETRTTALPTSVVTGGDPSVALGATEPSDRGSPAGVLLTMLVLIVAGVGPMFLVRPDDG